MNEPEPATTSNNTEQDTDVGTVEGPIRWAGVDWSWSEHAVCVIDDSGAVIERFTVTHTKSGLSTLVTTLHRHQITGVAIERGDGPVVAALLDAGLEWRQLFAGAEREISILVYAALFLAEDVELLRLLADKARADVTVRLLLADPGSPLMAQRGAEEGIGSAVAARVQNALSLFRPLLESGEIAARQHQTVLYNSIFRADDEMLVNPQVHGIAAAYAPVLHLRNVEPGGMFATYTDCFDRVWSSAKPLNLARTTA